ncbi:hypothetical protein AB996_0272 [Lactococcus cremoris]|uniref:Uncharacterized protein n=1 Tax=Lactococcus lactis subsp. cremoris TaxID=1359 RepID=A0A166KH70_LACLC|nr:hypothetical protein AB996_0272 [Lactococcus cremoris]
MIIFSIEKLFVSKKLSPNLAKVFNFILIRRLINHGQYE